MMARQDDRRRRRGALQVGFVAVMIFAMLVGAVGISPQPAAAQELRPQVYDTLLKIPARTTRSKVIACPRRTFAVSGGVRSTRLDRDVNVVASAPTDVSGKPVETTAGERPTRWFVAIKNLTPRQSQARIYVLCLPFGDTSSEAFLETTDVLVDPGPLEPGDVFIGINGAGRVNCGESARLVGGGVAPISFGALRRTSLVSSGPLRGGTDPVDIYDLQSGDSPGSWYANFTLNELPAATFRIFAVCVGGLDSMDVVLRISDFTVPGQATRGTTRHVACPVNERFVSGGVLGPTERISTLQTSGPLLPSGSNRRATGWRVAVSNGSVSPVTYRAIAICQPENL